MDNYNYGLAYNRPQESIAPTQYAPNINYGNVNFADWGFVPGVAQVAQNTPPNNFVSGQSYFSARDFNLAQWFTTRVHLAPLANLLGVKQNG